jgi:tRNA (cytidine/uridine-2'-O-)-methyltransferase
VLNVVLVQPEIPANTGNVGRTCVLAGARLHLVGPFGFDLSDMAVRRAGLAYWHSLDLVVHANWDTFVRDALGVEPGTPLPSGTHLLTKIGARTYDQAAYHDGDWLVFGRESAGLDQQLIVANPDRCERIPMVGDEALVDADRWHVRHDELHPELHRDICGNFVDPREGQISSLNLSNAVAIVLFEALRQQGFPGLR